jgi:hypothetical protein
MARRTPGSLSLPNHQLADIDSESDAGQSDAGYPFARSQLFGTIALVGKVRREI